MSHSDAPSASHSAPATHSRWSKWKRPLTVVFFLALIVLLTMFATRIEWAEVLQTLADFKVRTLIIAAGITLVSFLTYASFDLIGRTYIRQDLTWKQILPVGIISYAFNLNLSAWVGGIAMRYRLYSRLGVSKGNIAKILGLSLATNWFGYMTIAGVVFSSGLVSMPPGWKISSTALQGIGVLLLLISAGYLAACQFSKRREWSIRGVEINLPSLRMAVLQLLLGALNWSLMAAVIFTLLPSKLDYPLVLGVLLISAIAGGITHIPAGLGVLEAVFVALQSRSDVRCVIVAGEGGHFCAGGDIAEYADFRFEESSLRAFHEDDVWGGLGAMLACDLPLLAQIEGNCMGAGVEMASCCDIRVASSGARFGAPIARLGFPMAPDEAAILLASMGRDSLAEVTSCTRAARTLG